LNGVINLLKPPGMTSNDAVVWARRMCGTRKCGHGGTLDPAACGVLPVLVGNATKLFDLMLGHEKTYVATVRFGQTTDTLDAEGAVTAQSDVLPEREAWEEALKRFTGTVRQIPPLYSAVRVNGVHAYQLARKGAQAEVPQRDVTVFSVRTLAWRDERTVTIRVRCSSGTYIRTLVSDLAWECGCIAYLAQLTREQSGMFRLQDAVTVEQILRAQENGTVETLLVPTQEVLGEYGILTVRNAALIRAVNGGSLDRTAILEDYESNRMYQIHTEDHQLISLSTAQTDGTIRPQIMLFSGKTAARETEGGTK